MDVEVVMEALPKKARSTDRQNVATIVVAHPEDFN